MNKQLGIALVAAVVSLSGAIALATPAEASIDKMCSPSDVSYGRQWVDASCRSEGYSGGTLSSCDNNGDGTITVGYRCNV